MENKKFNIGDRVSFKNTISKLSGTIIGIFEEDVPEGNSDIIVYKGAYKVQMDGASKGSFTPASAAELEIVP